jgi:hypothetical protein
LSVPVGFRLNEEKDADILTDLLKYKDKTARVKEIYRMALHIINAPACPIPTAIVTKPIDNIESRPEPLVWKIPKEPTVRTEAKAEVKPNEPGSLKSRILKNRF